MYSIPHQQNLCLKSLEPNNFPPMSKDGGLEKGIMVHWF